MEDLNERYESMLASVDDAKATAKREASERAKRAARINYCVRQLGADIGQRYLHCTLANYDVENASQRTIVGRLTNIVQRPDDFIAGKHGLFFYGTCGTGKDHLMIAVLKVMANHGHLVRWKNCRDLWGEIADSYRDDRPHRGIYRELAEPEILCLSDPVSGYNQKETRLDMLNKIVSRRYDALKPTWITTNVADLEGAKSVFGVDCIERVLENSIVHNFRWKTHRKPLE